jgi:hypothetical protein
MADPILLPKGLEQEFGPEVASMAETDVLKQRGNIPDLQLMEYQWSDIMNSTTQQEVEDKLNNYGLPNSYGDPSTSEHFVLNINTINALNQNRQAKGMRFQTFYQTVGVPPRPETDQAVPFTQQTPEKKYQVNIPEVLPKGVNRDDFEHFVSNYAEIAEILADPENPALTQQGKNTMLRIFTTGKLSKELEREFWNIVGGGPRLPHLGAMAFNATTASLKTTASSIPFIGSAFYETSEADLSFGEFWMKNFSESQNNYMKTVGAKWETFLDNTGVFESGANNLQEIYKREFIKDHDVDAWMMAHQRPKMATIQDPNDPTRFIEVPVNKNGRPLEPGEEPVFEDVPLSRDLAFKLLDGSRRQLTNEEEALIYFLPAAALSLGIVSGASHRGNQLQKFAENKRKTNPTAYGNLDDFQVLQKYKRNEANLAEKAWSLGLSTLTLTSRKGALKIHYRTQEKLNVLTRYDADISGLNREIKDLDDALEDGKIDIATHGEESRFLYKRRDALVQGRKGYVARYGGKYFKSPYTRGIFADEALIAGIQAYGPEMLGYVTELDEDSSETLSVLFSPVIAPVTTKTGTYITGKLVGGVDFVTKRTITSAATFLEDSRWIPLIQPGVIVGGNIAEFRRAMKQAGVEVTAKEEAVFITLGQMLSVLPEEGRERALSAFQKYGEYINGIEDEVLALGYTKESPEYKELMSGFHRNTAEVLGLPYLMSLQEVLSAADVRPGAVLSRRKVQRLFELSIVQENQAKAVSSTFRLIKERFEKDNIDIEGNEVIQSFFQRNQQFVEGMEERTRDLRNHLNEGIDILLSTPEKLEQGDLEDLWNMKFDLDPDSFSTYQSQADFINESTNRMLTEVEISLQAITDAVGNADTEILAAQQGRYADIVFDIEEARRRSLVRAAYAGIEEAVPELAENPDAFNLNTIALMLMNEGEEYRNDSIARMFGRDSDFWATSGIGGNRVYKIMNKAAERNLTKKFGEDAAAMFESFRNGKFDLDPVTGIMGNEDSTYLDFVLYLQSKSEQVGDTTGTNLLMANVDEVENIYRYMRDREILYQLSKNPNQSTIPLMNKFNNAINQTYADVSVDLLGKVLVARKTHEKLMGAPTDKPNYAGKVMGSRGRMQKRDRTGKYTYRNNKNLAREPFDIISDSISQYVFNKNELSSKQQSKLKDKIREQIHYIMRWYGAEQVGPAATTPTNYVFDLRDPRQRRVANMLQSLIESDLAVTSQEVVTDAQKRIERSKDATGFSLANPDLIISKELINNLSNPDFDRASRVKEVGDILTINVINEDGSPGVRRLANTESILAPAKTLDELFTTDKNLQREVRDLTNELKNIESPVRQQAKDIVDRENAILKTMSQFADDSENPARFWESNFANATPESIRQRKEELVALGMDKDEVNEGFRILYFKGLKENIGLKYGADTFSSKGKQQISKVDDFINYVNDPAHKAVMIEMLGETHYKSLERLATIFETEKKVTTGFRSHVDTKGFTPDGLLAQAFAYARGIVGPGWLGGSVAIRTHLQSRQSVLNVALSNPEFAESMVKILDTPEGLMPKEARDLNGKFSTILKSAIAYELIVNPNFVIDTEAVMGIPPSLIQPQEPEETEEDNQ